MDEAYFKDTFHFSDSTGVPCYLQLASYFKIQLQAGALKPGDPMIPENRLCGLLGISRTTVRQAMDCLVREGLIVRQRGRGTFVADKKMSRPISHLYNFTENMKALGAVPSSRVLIKEVTEAIPAPAAACLKLPAGQKKAFHLTRIRCAGKEPLLVEDTYVPYYLCPGIERFSFESDSLYAILSGEYQLGLYHASESIEAVIMDKKNARLLKCREGIAGYKICRVSNLESGFAYEYTSSLTRADRCVFQLDLYSGAGRGRNEVQFQRRMNLK